MMTLTLSSCLDSKKAQKEKKTSFLKEPVENADLHKTKQWPHKNSA